jgi:hypothetical protein
MNDHIDDGEAGRLDDGQEESFDLDPEPEEFDEIDKAYRREQLQWLADRGLCSWSEAVEYLRARSCRSRVRAHHAQLRSSEFGRAIHRLPARRISYRILYQDAAGLGGEVRWDG